MYTLKFSPKFPHFSKNKLAQLIEFSKVDNKISRLCGSWRVVFGRRYENPVINYISVFTFPGVYYMYKVCERPTD